jgi:ABC-type nitrate/sulfonate/bicarbonate transport system ATPase subunit/ABC-type nitrate/sulfonate/bicarbonate transport system permease component
MKKRLIGLISIIILFIIWIICAWIVGEYILPTPWTSLYDAFLLLTQPINWQQILFTLGRVVVGFGIAFFLGVVIGLTMGIKENLSFLFKPLIFVIQGVPPILWAIPLIIILRNSTFTSIIVITLICLPTVVLTIYEGAKAIPKTLKQMLRLFAPGSIPYVKELAIPYLKPFFLSSIKISLVLGIKASAVAEFFGANDGIGFQIQVAYQSLLIHKLFAWGIIFISLILFANFLLEQCERILLIKKSKLKQYNAISNIDWSQEQRKNSLNVNQNYESILLKNISFHYQNKNTILNNINFHLAENELAIITGDSGAGKTTLLYIIASLLKPQSGTVKTSNRIGFIFQDDRFLPWRNNIFNVALPLLYSGLSKKESFSFAYNLIKEVGLESEAFNYPEELSGGMKKRLAFARCFASLPKLVLMDEPFSGLHQEAREVLWQKFYELLQVYPVPSIIVTHYPQEVPQTSLLKAHYYQLSIQEKQLKPIEVPDYQISQ